MGTKPSLYTCLSPSLIPIYDLHSATAVVIDIFRATSTICAALDNGARAVIPVATVEECRNLEREQPHLITAGERDGHVIKGLKGGNSPLEYTPETIADRTLALTTTNGTRLLHFVKHANGIVVGSFLNINALCDYLVNKGQDVVLACGGWRNRINLEDTLFAGAVIDQIGDQFNINCDSCFMAQSLYQQALQAASIFDFLKSGSHYHRLCRFHLEKDMRYCCAFNLHPVVPVFKDPYLVLEKETKSELA